MYRAIIGFCDREDFGFEYRSGDEYPRSGFTPTDARIAELSSDKNRMKMALIKKESAEKKTQKTVAKRSGAKK